MKEVIFGSRNQYKVNDEGNVFTRTINSSKNLSPYWRKMKPCFGKCDHTGNGYYTINLDICGSLKSYRLHRIVAIYLVDGYKIGLHVNHIDGNRRNNHSSNLEWVTPKENTRNARHRGVEMGGTTRRILDHEKLMRMIFMINNGFETKDIVKEFEVHHSIVSNLRHKKNTYKEYHHLVNNPLPKRKGRK